MAEHRVSMLRASLRRRVDPARSRDPRIRAVVAQLHDLEVAPAPDPAFRAELRAQLVAVAARIIAESESGAVAERVDPAGKRSADVAIKAPAAASAKHASSRTRRISIKRPLQIATAVVAVCALLLGGAVWMSRKAVPGENLYGLKRASERVQLAFDTDDTSRAHDRLEFARTRVDEVKTLWTRATSQALGEHATASGGVNARTAQLIDETLSSADADVTSAARTLNDQAVRNGSTNPLQTITSWAPSQLDLLAAIRSQMPAGSLYDRATASWQVVHAASTRSADLRPQVGSGCAKTTVTDRFGHVPCTARPKSVPAPTAPPSSQPTAPRGSGSAGTSGRSGGNSGSNSGGSAPQRSRSAGSSTARRSSAPSTTPSRSKGVLPKLPITVPSPKISVGKCVSVSAGPLDVGVGSCSN
jgi:hypothetical protein